MALSTPILLITFNRPQHTQRVLSAILAAEPRDIYIFQDGPREGNDKDRLKCQEVRDVVNELTSAYAVSHPQFTLHTLYQEQNLGCGPGPVKGISWFFDQVEQGIVMEDDCMPHLDFFAYCEELLDRYKNNHQVQFINATLYHNRWHCADSYGFSHYMITGAWAAWRETWQGFDLDLHRLNAWSARKQILHLTENRAEANWWYFKIKEIQKDTEKKSYWDYQMQIHLFMNSAITIHPAVNLISNIGFDAEGTHTTWNDGYGNRSVSPILPLQHPVQIFIDTSMDADCFAKRQSRGRIIDTLSFIKHLCKNL